jgi:hypothetical protein
MRIDWLWTTWVALHGFIVVSAAYVLVPVTLAVAGDPVTVRGGQVADPTAAQLALNGLIRVPTAVVVLAGLLLLTRIVGAACKGDPFTAGNVRLLRILGIVLLAGGASADIVAEVARRALQDPSAGGFVWSGWWLSGIGFLAVSEVFRRGVALRSVLDEVI